jgi:hypothetical protein
VHVEHKVADQAANLVAMLHVSPTIPKTWATKIV